MSESELKNWIESHRQDYRKARSRVEKTRTMMLWGELRRAAEILRKSYIFAVLSIKTPLERHERAFTQWAAGDVSLASAAEETVYGRQKYDWMEETISSHNWVVLAQAIRLHIKNNRKAVAIDVIEENLKGVSYRKGSFMLAMAGCHEFICIDSHIAEFAGYEESDNGSTLEFFSAENYFETCDEVIQQIPSSDSMPPFLMQWAVYDWMRGEHARHMAFYREALPEPLQDSETQGLSL